MNARNLSANSTQGRRAMENAKLPDVWKRDFTTISPVERRAARYALQLVNMERKYLESEGRASIEGTWKIVSPLVDDIAANAAFDAFTHSDKSPSARLLTWQKRLLLELPSGLIERLMLEDGNSPTQPCVQMIAEMLSLNIAETRILDYLGIRSALDGFDDFLRIFESAVTLVNHQRLAAMLEVPQSDVVTALLSTSTLRLVKLAEIRNCHRRDLEDFIDPSTGLIEILMAAPETVQGLSNLLMEISPPPAWSVEDFHHMETAASRLAKVLPNAAKQGVVGVNALLFGPPGTGKTEFARALAQTTGLTLYQVRNADEDGDGMNRDGRLTAYLLAQRILLKRRDAVILFDEVEDVFADDEGAMLRMMFGAEQTCGKEKGFMNHLLETNPVPTIWVSNNVCVMDAAFLRRFLLPVEFNIPPRSVRRRMIERHLGECNIRSDFLDELAADAKLAPAQFGDARRLLELHDSKNDAMENERIVREGVGSIRRLLHGSRSFIKRRASTVFDVDFLNIAGGVSPRRIAIALDRTGQGSLCFYGPPGTGKTEFAYVLADALGKELVIKNSSDLVSKYVGETEQNIAKVFNTVDAERSILLIDEVDSFLRDRREAKNAWEVTAVNELLQHMESYPGIFIAATNLMSGIDPAALRRFDFKLAFQPLTLPQRLAMFAREALGDIEAANSLPSSIVNRLAQLESLTPGDFANVCRQREILAEDLAPEEFVRRLVRECCWKTAA